MFIKICGITSEEDALLAVAMGADAVGFVFAPSPRQIAVGRARDIAKRLPPEVLTVGVFRDELPTRVVDSVTTAGLRAAQLHGRETIDDAAYVRERVPVLIKAFSAGSRLLDRAADYQPDAILVDSPAPGSGELFDWSLLDGARRGHRLILAGGLDPDNIADAIAKVQPWGVDVSTGVEASPGHKDPARVRAFIRNAREAAPPPDEPVGDDGPYDWQSEAS
jgi:phosphoribosylanthranilate isomerase